MKKILPPPLSSMMAKRLLGVMFAVVLSIFSTKAQDLVYDGITPAPGSEISSFDFELKFDFSKIIEANGNAEYGVGWVGLHNDKLPSQEKSVTLYEGSQEDGIVIGRLCTSNYNGKTAGFEATDIVKLNFEGAVPKPGVKYTMVITNQFKVYTVVKGSSAISNSTFDCFKTPITYEFIGGQASTETVSITDCSLSTGQSLEGIDNVTISFSVPVAINSNEKLVIKEGDNVVASSTSALVSEDGMSVTYTFDNVILYSKHNYSVVLPANAVYSASDDTMGNQQFTVSIDGSSFQYFAFVSSSPEQDSTSIFSSIEASFELPDGLTIYKQEGVQCDLSAKLYVNSVSEENLIGKLDGVGNGNGLTWTNKFALEPSSTYIVFVPKGQFPPFITSENKYNYELRNSEVNIILHTPSIEDSGIPKIEFQAPVLGVYNANGDNVTLNNGDKVSEITSIDILLKDLRYSYNGEYLSAMTTEPGLIEIYDITDGSPVLVNTYKLLSQQYETTTYYYTVRRAYVRSLFYEGRKYRLVIPAGTVTCAKKPLQNFAGNEEYTVEFEGATPTTVELISCSLEENAEVSELPIVTWNFKGQFVKNPDVDANLITPAGGGWHPTYVTVNNSGETIVQAFFYRENGSPITLRKGEKYTVWLPEGLIYNAGDPSIKNEEMRINITGVEKTPEVVAPEFVKVTAEVNGIATVEQHAVKGEKATITIAPTEDWIVESVEGASLSGENTYTTPELTDDTIVKAKLAYDGAWAVEVTTGVWEIAEDNISIARDGQLI
ncbi:MAG: hypothetical protein HDS74_00950, partial [Bacteroidales bacterium]|nr:hypothetical protein [Bacteroidales bacterium]